MSRTPRLRPLLWTDWLMLAHQAPSEVMEWEDFKALYGREYGADEEARRAEVFARSIAKIVANNAEADASGNADHVRLGVNDFADMTETEWKMLNTFKLSNTSAAGVTILPSVDAAATIDWRTKGAVTPVKNQYRCGARRPPSTRPHSSAAPATLLLPLPLLISVPIPAGGCWSFASVAVVEAAYKAATGTLRSLSEQQLLDCSNQGGCLGGTTPGGLGYAIANHGLDQESEYTWSEGHAPNPPPKFPCWKAAEANHVATIASQAQVKVGDEAQVRFSIGSGGFSSDARLLFGSI